MIMNSEERSANMENKVCERVLELLNEYIDGELNESDAEFVRAHIEICPECKKVYSDLLEVERLFDEASEEVPDGFLDSVMTKISSEKQNAAKPSKKPMVFWGKFGGVAVAAAVMLTVVASPLISRMAEDQAWVEVTEL